MKKLISLLLAMIMVFSLAATAFADNTDGEPAEGEDVLVGSSSGSATTQTGSITVNSVGEGTVYRIYRLLDLESYNKDSGAYSYKVNETWRAFFETAEAKEYVSVASDDYVAWKAGEDDATVAAFAKLALAYAKENNIEPEKCTEHEGEYTATETSIVFYDLPLGWYLVDSTAGALCGLTTTDPDASVNAKNHKPTIDKQVQEDLSGMWGDVNTADIGQIVNFMTIIHVAAGAENYVLHDAMSNGLTFVHDNANQRGVTEVKHITSAGVETTLTEGVEYTVHTSGLCGTDEGCDFEVRFDDAFVAGLKANERLIIYYNAMLNRHAVIDGDNTNESWLAYAEEKFTTHDKTKTHTFSIDIVKTDSSNKLIDGAEFRIYDQATGGNEIEVVQLMEADDVTPVLDKNGNPMYRRARADETGVPIVVKDGLVTVVGFDNGVYYLEETVVPAGYNKLPGRVEFTIADGNLSAIFNNGIFSTGSGVHVVNKNGSMLPETGATGTAMFITFGMFVMLGTGILLVTKKRMSMIED
jgi:fimbrial isopeptide formation D2 family protein/LPXTG-motif cell wall-anchored protein